MSEILSPDQGQNSQPDELGNALRLANMALKVIPGDQRVPDGLRDSIQQKLDELWPYDRSDCSFSGYCQVIASTEQGSKFDEEFVDIADGVSNGFWVAKFGREGFKRWAVALGFQMYEEDEQNRMHRTDYLLHTVAPYGVVPHEEVDDAFPEDLEFADIQSVLSRRSDELAYGMQEDNFFMLNVEEQRYYVDVSLAAAEGEIEGLGGVNGPVVVSGEYAYVVASGNTGKHYARLSIDPVLIKGSCTGMMVLERQRIAQDVHISGPQDMVQLGAGICLVIKLDAETAESLVLDKDTEIYVPVSGQDIEVVFDIDSLRFN